MKIAYLETMACGLPVVGADVLGVSEPIKNGETGWLVLPRSPERMAAAIKSVLEEPATAARMGKTGRQRVEERFSIERQVSDLLAFWQRGEA